MRHPRLLPANCESRRLHRAGAFLDHDMHLARQNAERIQWLLAEAQNGTTTAQYEAACERMIRYGFGF